MRQLFKYGLILLCLSGCTKPNNSEEIKAYEQGYEKYWKKTKPYSRPPKNESMPNKSDAHEEFYGSKRR